MNKTNEKKDFSTTSVIKKIQLSKVNMETHKQVKKLLDKYTIF